MKVNKEMDIEVRLASPKGEPEIYKLYADGQVIDYCHFYEEEGIEVAFNNITGYFFGFDEEDEWQTRNFISQNLVEKTDESVKTKGLFTPKEMDVEIKEKGEVGELYINKKLADWCCLKHNEPFKDWVGELFSFDCLSDEETQRFIEKYLEKPKGPFIPKEGKKFYYIGAGGEVVHALKIGDEYE